MPREVEPPTSTREFVLGALKERIRVDGRSLLQGRKPELVFGDELGYVECSLGKTKYVTTPLHLLLWAETVVPAHAE